MGAENAWSALKGADVAHCEFLQLRMLCSHLVLFEEGALAHAPCGSGPAPALAEQWLRSWGSQMNLMEGLETGCAFFSALTR